jgi:hypothetical protein
MIVVLIIAFLFGFTTSGAADSSENKAKSTGKEIWETLKKDLKEVKTTVKEQGKKSGEASKRNLKEAKETFKPDKSKSKSSE